MTSCLVALLHIIRQEWHAAQHHVETAATLADEYGFTDWRSQALIFQGYVAVRLGRGPEGVLQLRQGLRAYCETGAELGRPLFLGLLADAYGRIARPEEGLTMLAEALAATRQNGLRVQEAWLCWRKGELLLQAADTQQSESLPCSSLSAQRAAEECFHHALDIARQHSAKSLELRVTTSLSRLWQSQGRKEDARQLLAEIYGWFTEGFDTADLREAKTLLDALAG
jgi:predicted ATPase